MVMAWFSGNSLKDFIVYLICKRIYRCDSSRWPSFILFCFLIRVSV